MNQKRKIRVAVLYGGRSAEHEVSIQSAKNIMEQIDRTRFEVVPIGIDKKGQWFLGQEIFAKSLAHQEVIKLAPNETWFSPNWIATSFERSVSTTMSHDHLSAFDVVFPAVHGSLCEDGTLQGLLETANLPYVGCGVLSSAITMDKDIAKRLAESAGIKVGPYLAIKKDDWLGNQSAYEAQIEKKLGYPVFVKPANTGSSIGISKVSSKEKLNEAIIDAYTYDAKIIVEKALRIQELEVAVLESLQSPSTPIVSIVGEIKTKHEFYSYEAKYLDEHGAELIIPATISEEASEKSRLMAKELFLKLECQGMARIDLFLNLDDNDIYFNEVNTIPGFTSISMYPKLMESSGITYTEILTRLIELALKRHHTQSELKRSIDKCSLIST